MFGMDLNSPTPEQIASQEGGDFRGLCQIMLAKLEKTSQHGRRVIQVIPSYVSSTLGRMGIRLVLHDPLLSRWVNWTISKWIHQSANGDVIDVWGLETDSRTFYKWW